MFDSPIVSRRIDGLLGKRKLFISEETDLDGLKLKKPKMSDALTKDDLHIILRQLKCSEENITLKVNCIQNDITSIRLKQDSQDIEINKINNNQDKLFQFHGDVIKRLDDLEKGDKNKRPNQRTNLTAYQERLSEQVSKTILKIAIYDLPDGKDTSFIREQAAKMDLPHEIKQEIQNCLIEFIPDKRGPRAKNKGKLHHMTTSGLHARQAILHAAKNRPGNMRWDIVIPKDLKLGHNKQKGMCWQLRNGMKLSVQHEIHGHTAFVYINEKDNTSKRRIFSEFSPIEKEQRGRRHNDMDTDAELTDVDKPIVFYEENKSIADELASIIFWTGIDTEENDNTKKMQSLKVYMSEDDFSKINDKTIHSKYQTRLCFNSKEDAVYVYNKYKSNNTLPKEWDWSIFNLSDFRLE